MAKQLLLKPGHPTQIGSGSEGTIYIDDFEGSRSTQDMRFPAVSWMLASTPQDNGLSRGFFNKRYRLWF